MSKILDFYRHNSVGKDFDECCYIKENPNAKNFLQPYCSENGIDERRRLFYHWHMFGRSKVVNFIPSVCPRAGFKNRLAVITSIFNPCGYTNLIHNYLQFSRKIRRQADLFTIELSFDGTFLEEDSRCIRMAGTDENILWQKERLLNILLETVPKEYTDIAWIDADIIFTDDLWPARLYDALSRYKVVQMFNMGSRIGMDGKRASNIGSRICRTWGSTGLAWAARREVVDEVGFLDNQVLGGADRMMCSAFMDDPSVTNGLKHVDNERTRKWMERARSVVGRSVNCMSGEILHMYHGSHGNRNYRKRYDMLEEDGDFFVKDGLWRCENPSLTSSVKSYFMSRMEDDNVIKINDYFDRVYVLNLDRDKERLLKIGGKLASLGIKFERFPAVDGEGIDYKCENFVEGMGMLENRFAMGCLLSHLRIIDDAKKNGYGRILILEDDIMFCENFDALLQNIRKIDEWKLLYLGASQHRWEGIEYLEDFYCAKNTAGTFAYAVDRSIYEEFAHDPDDPRAIDRILMSIQDRHHGKCFVSYPNLIVADVTSSSIRPPRDQTEHSEKMRWNIQRYK